VGTSISFRNVLGAPHKPEEKWCLGRTMKQRARKKYYFEIKKTWSENACMVVCKYIVERTRPELAGVVLASGDGKERHNHYVRKKKKQIQLYGRFLKMQFFSRLSCCNTLKFTATWHREFLKDHVFK
jgi:hypothetical protein